MSKILIKNATVFTVNSDRDILEKTDILIDADRISKIGTDIKEKVDTVIDATGKVILPGFVQTHTHLCQTLFRGLAENRQLLSWLREKIWPLEAAHNEISTYYAALLGIGELISGGTTTVLDMGPVKYADKVFKALAESGIRSVCGKGMMDSGYGVPANLLEKTDESIAESIRLFEKWHGFDNGRIQYSFAPRFILSVSDDLLKEVRNLSQKFGVSIHTHSSENLSEGEEVFKLKGMKEFEYFEKLGILNDKFLAAHCVWVDDKDIEIIKSYDVKVLHCPSSNFKLGSGMLNVFRLLNNGINVSIGADGAPCNNNLDMLNEIRVSALMQNVLNGPENVDAYKFIEMATIGGARALGLDNEIGTVESGKKADLIVIDLDSDFHSWHSSDADIATRIVYSARSENIKSVIINGQIVMREKELKTLKKHEVLHKSRIEADKLVERCCIDKNKLSCN